MNKHLINIRGASASGKTTAVKQFCRRAGMRIETVDAPFGKLPLSILSGGKIVVLGDYEREANCLGADRFKNGMRDIIDSVMEISNRFAPKVILYEHLISSLATRGTKQVAQVAEALGYDFWAVTLLLSEEKRLANLHARSGDDCGLNTFDKNNVEKVRRMSENLAKNGLNVIPINVDGIRKENMWRIVDYAIRQADAGVY